MLRLKQTNMNSLSDSSGRVVMAGISGAGLCRAIEGNSTIRVPALGSEVPLWGAIGGACMAGSALSQITHDFLLPGLAQDEKQSETNAMVLSAVSSSAGTCGALAAGISPQVLEELGYTRAIGYGLFATMLGDWSWSMVKPMVTM